MKILLLGSYGRRNIGDDVYLRVLLEKFKHQELHFNCWNVSNLPEEIQISDEHTVHPTNTRGYFGILKSLLTADKIVYGGGELWMKLQGSLVSDLSTYKMLLINLVARLLRKEVYYISVGAEPLTGWSKTIASWSAKLATKLYLRDSETADTLGASEEKSVVIPDMAYLLPSMDPKLFERNTGKKWSMAISTSSYVSQQDPGDHTHLEDVASAVNQVSPSGTVLLMSAMSDASAVERDQLSVDVLSKNITSDTETYEYSSISDFLTTLAQAKLVVSYRLHVGILAHLAGTTVVGIGYRPKVRKYFEEFSSKNAYVDIGSVSTQLADTILRSESYAYDQQTHTKKITSQAEEQYKAVFSEILGVAG